MKKEEPKTKRVAVIAFLDVWIDSLDYAYITLDHSEELEKQARVDLIDIGRLRYGVPKDGEKYIGNGIETSNRDYEDGSVLIIDPPKPKETLKQWLDRMPEIEDRDFDYEVYKKIMDWQSEKPEGIPFYL